MRNNNVLKKLRIALNLKEDGMLEIFARGGVELPPNQLKAFFRKEGHKHFRECSDQLLSDFLSGLVILLQSEK